jgi:hypothetical protein
MAENNMSGKQMGILGAMLLLGAAGAGITGAEFWNQHKAGQPVQGQPMASMVQPAMGQAAANPFQAVASTLQPAAAAAASTTVGVETLTFQVVSVGRGKDGSTIYLNSLPNFRAPGNQSIRVQPAAGVQPEAFIGKTVSASGSPYVSPTGGKSVTATPQQVSVR